MKKIIVLTVLSSILISCTNKKSENVNAEAGFVSFGDSISSEKALTFAEMSQKYASLKVGDTVEVKFKSTIKSVCKKKGCWMNVDLGNNQESFVKFKDYAFFVPKNAENQEVIMNGKAFVSVETVEELKHYAEDAGKSKAAIDSIVAPKTNFSFMANGVLIKK